MYARIYYSSPCFSLSYWPKKKLVLTNKQLAEFLFFPWETRVKYSSLIFEQKMPNVNAILFLKKVFNKSFNALPFFSGGQIALCLFCLTKLYQIQEVSQPFSQKTVHFSNL